MWLRETFCGEGESPSVDPSQGRKKKKTQQPCIAHDHLLSLSLLITDWQNPERVELRGVEFQVRCMCSNRSPVWEGSYPEFNQHWKSRKHHRKKGLISTIPLQGLLEMSRRRSCTSNTIVYLGVQEHTVAQVTYGIWCVWIRFCSWLQQWDDSLNEWFFTSVLRRQTVEPTWFTSVRRERDNKQGDA